MTTGTAEGRAEDVGEEFKVEGVFVLVGGEYGIAVIGTV
jgi:hypothetical protein